MAGKEIVVFVRGNANSGVTSLTSDLERHLREAGAEVTVDPSCTFGGESYGLPIHTFANLKGVKVTLMNQRMVNPSVFGSFELENGDDLIRFDNNDVFDIRTDRLINTTAVLDILQVSRPTLMRWIRENKFPRENFRFGQNARWVERLVREWQARTDVGALYAPSQHELDEAELHAKGVVTPDILDS